MLGWLQGAHGPGRWDGLSLQAAAHACRYSAPRRTFRHPVQCAGPCTIAGCVELRQVPQLPAFAILPRMPGGGLWVHGGPLLAGPPVLEGGAPRTVTDDETFYDKGPCFLDQNLLGLKALRAMRWCLRRLCPGMRCLLRGLCKLQRLWGMRAHFIKRSLEEGSCPRPLRVPPVQAWHRPVERPECSEQTIRPHILQESVEGLPQM